MTGQFHFLRIEVDGHFHGSSEVPKPWAARIAGINEKYGLKREFVEKMNDWRGSSRARSGNTYGVVATFALREGALYEVSRLRGKASKRHVAREFVWVEGGKLHPRKPLEALAYAEGHQGHAAPLKVMERPEEPLWVADVSRVGTPPRLGWVTSSGERTYRLRPGRIYEIRRGESQRFVAVDEDLTMRDLSPREVLEWMLAREQAA